MALGDLQVTTEPNHEELKAYDGSSWRTLFSADAVKGWIAALSLFEGTAKQVGGTAVPGAIELAALVDLAAADPAGQAAALAKVGHYWVWTGTPGYTVQAADPSGVGRDLATAQFQVGDWLQISNRGTAAAPDLRWVKIGGDLLARTRADSLFGLHDWAAGNYEKGSLINFEGAIYRATRDVLPVDTKPGTEAVAAVPAGPGGVPPAVVAVTAAPWGKIALTAGVHSVPADANLPSTAPASDVYLVLSSATAGGKAALYNYDTAAASWRALGGGVALQLMGGQQLISVGLPVGSITAWPTATAPPGYLLCHGQVFTAADYPELALVFPGLRVPDYRGAYLRAAGLNGNGGWGDAASVVGGWQEDSTARPKVEFFTDVQGDHHHTYTSATTSPVGGGSYQVGYNAQAAQTANSGAHTHSITGGGDTETRPKTFLVEYIIKATDQAVVARPAPVSP